MNAIIRTLMKEAVSLGTLLFVAIPFVMHMSGPGTPASQFSLPQTGISMPSTSMPSLGHIQQRVTSTFQAGRMAGGGGALYLSNSRPIFIN